MQACRAHTRISPRLRNPLVRPCVQGRLDEAAPLYFSALERYTCERGPEHEDTAAIATTLCKLLRAQGRAGEADSLDTGVYAIADGSGGA
eukprot:319242-Chlamydomonas_euryale.AAC.1